MSSHREKKKKGLLAMKGVWELLETPTGRVAILSFSGLKKKKKSISVVPRDIVKIRDSSHQSPRNESRMTKQQLNCISIVPIKDILKSTIN